MGEEIPQLDKITRMLAEKAGNLKGVAGVVLRYKSARPELIIYIDKGKVGRSGIQPSEISSEVRYAVQGGVATKYLDRNREMDIRIRFAKKFRTSLNDLQNFSFPTPSGKYAPLSELSRMRETKAPVKIYRKNKKRTLSFSLQTEDQDFSTISDNLEKLKKIPLPENYRLQFGKEIKKHLESRRRIYATIALALVLVYMILASYFESFIKPLVIILPLPIPVLSAIIALYIFGYSLSIPAYTGFILLTGIVINQIFFLSKYIEEQIISFELKTMSNVWKTIYLDHVGQFTHMTLIIAGFYLPMIFSGGPGGGLIKGITIVIFVGMLTSALTTPILTVMYYMFFPDAVKFARSKTQFLNNFILHKVYKTEIEPQ